MRKAEDTFDVIVETQELQEMSVVNYMAAKGYEPVYKHDIGLASFRQPLFDHIGEGRISVGTAIRLHNNEAENTFDGFVIDPKETFHEFVADNVKYDQIVTLFAGTTKIVKKAKLVFSRKRGLEVQSHKIEFMTKRDRNHFGRILGI